MAPSTGPVLVLGAHGMLGHKVVQVAAATLDVYATVRDPEPGLAALLGIPDDHLVPNVDVTGPLDALFERCRPGVVVNCAGVLKPVSGPLDPCDAIAVNSLAPHRLAAAASARGARLIHVSTDCTFDGRRGHYREDDPPDATDLYGRSKALGEVTTDGHLTIRTSIIGRQLRGSRGLLEWFLAQRGLVVSGYRAMVFSGVTTQVLSRAIVALITDHPAVSGLVHVGGEAISKYDLLHLVNDSFQAGVTIEPAAGPHIDRSLDASRFAALVGAPPAWRQMLAEAASDPTPYDAWRQRVS